MKHVRTLFAKLTLERELSWLLLVVGAALVAVSISGSDIASVLWKDIDEWSFLGSLVTMQYGITHFNPYAFFGFVFYNYGFVYFLTLELVSLPFLLIHQISIVLIATRLFSALFALLSVWGVHTLVRRIAPRWVALGVSLLFVLMPGFWRNGTWFHPDFPMTFFVLLSLIFLEKDRLRFAKDWWWACISLGMAIALKFQAITFLPLLVCTAAYPLLYDWNATRLWQAIIRASKAVCIAFGVFVALNPYIFHPMGSFVWWRMFRDNMISNATNHGSATNVSLFDKAHDAIGLYYLHPLLVFVLIVGATILLMSRFRSKQYAFWQVLLVTVLINFAYLFIAVNKSWQHYYLSVMVVSLPLFGLILQKSWQRFAMPIAIFVIILQGIMHAPQLLDVVRREDEGKKAFIVQQDDDNDFLISELSGKLEPGDRVLIAADTKLDFPKLGLRYADMRVIYGPLQAKDVTDVIKVVIIRKDSVYYRPEILQKVRNPKPYEDARSLFQSLTGEPYNFVHLAENQDLAIFYRD